MTDPTDADALAGEAGRGADGPPGDSPGDAPRRPPRLPAGVRRRIAVRSGSAAALASGLALAVALGPTWPAGTPTAILVGHAVGQVVALSWVVGALLTFDASSGAFMGGTLGLAPVRLLVAVGGLGLAAAWFELTPAPLALAFVGTHVVGLAIEAYTFNALAGAAAPDDHDPPAPRPPHS